MTKPNDLNEMTPEEFRQATGNQRLVVLYPRNRYRNRYLERYLKVPDSGLYYYSLQTSDRNLRKFLMNLVEDLNANTDGFGDNINAALSNKAKAPTLAEALAADLDTLSDDQFVLLLDQFDRLPEKDETKRFMDSLVEKIPSQAQVVVNAREQAYMPWFDLVSTKRAAVLGAEYIAELGFHDPTVVEEVDVPRIEVFSLGSGYALVNGAPVTQWDGELPKNLFFFFVDRPLVTRDEIFDAFWPTLSVKEATNVFHVTKRKINERLGYDLTQYASGFYNHNEELEIYYDVSDFSKSVEEAMSTGEGNQADEWERAADLYRAPFLHRLDMDWTKQRRRELRDQHAQALIGLGRLYHSQSEIDKAIRAYGRALRETPQREDIHRQMMELYHQKGDIDSAAAQYRSLERTLRETLNIAPSPETKNLYNLITGTDPD